MASFSPEQLKSTILSQGGIARTNKYSVIITAPSGIPSLNDQGALRRLEYMCESVSLPTKSLATVEKNIHGPVYALPYRMTFTEASMSFYLTDQMPEKKYFDYWQSRIVDPKSGNMMYYEDYTTDIIINKFPNEATSTNDAPSYSIKLLNAWPSIVAEIGLSHSGGGEIAKLPVTFQYRKWEPADGNGAFPTDFGVQSSPPTLTPPTQQVIPSIPSGYIPPTQEFTPSVPAGYTPPGSQISTGRPPGR